MNLPEKKAAVFRAVLKLLRQGRPLGDLKVSEIAEAAGIGKGTVYEYFPSREELLRDAMQYSRAQGFQELYAAISDAEGFEARWKVIEITARQLLECSSVFFSQVPSMGFPQAALYDICGGGGGPGPPYAGAGIPFHGRRGLYFRLSAALCPLGGPAGGNSRGPGRYPQALYCRPAVILVSAGGRLGAQPDPSCGWVQRTNVRCGDALHRRSCAPLACGPYRLRRPTRKEICTLSHFAV